MKTIKQTLMARDGISAEDAQDILDDLIDDVMAIMNRGGSLRAVEDALCDATGLEPDFIDELLEKLPITEPDDGNPHTPLVVEHALDHEDALGRLVGIRDEIDGLLEQIQLNAVIDGVTADMRVINALREIRKLTN